MRSVFEAYIYESKFRVSLASIVRVKAHREPLYEYLLKFDRSWLNGYLFDLKKNLSPRARHGFRKELPPARTT